MYEYKVKVVKVIDGDTIDVDIDLGFNTVLTKRRIRLYGIDTPESRTRDKEEKQRGLLSKEYLLLKCPIGEYITLKSHGVGKFGRILGELFEYNKYEDSISINQEMCDEAYAAPYFGQSKEDIKQLHLENKQKLISRGLL
jgi:micrococcal nuclease|tara:strand:- start:402 stop:821 length:420 start_codon:yes stop_codon:yes gene_type:complete